MSASKGRYLAWYLGTSLVGVSEHNSRAVSCPCVPGRDTAAVQADGRARRLREDLTEGPPGCPLTAGQQIVAQEGAAALSVCLLCVFPIAHEFCAHEQAGFGKTV